MIHFYKEVLKLNSFVLTFVSFAEDQSSTNKHSVDFPKQMYAQLNF